MDAEGTGADTMATFPLPEGAIHAGRPALSSPAPATSRSTRTRRCGFALVELLVVMGVMSIVLLLLVPSLRKSMRHAAATVCLQHLREIDRALQAYRIDHRGWLPDVREVRYGEPLDPHGAAWYGRLRQGYLDDAGVLECDSDPARLALDVHTPLNGHSNPAHASSYGMNEIIRLGKLGNVERHGPQRPLETMLLADLGPDHADALGRQEGGVFRNGSWMAWDDQFHPATAGLADSWLTGRHMGRINVLTLGGSAWSVRTSGMMLEHVQPFYRGCAAGGCALCAGEGLPHYSFASSRLFWWTGPIRFGE